MAEIHGSKTVLLHNAVNLTQYLKDDLEFGGGDRELHDTTGYGDVADSHMVSPIKKGVPINIGGIYSPELHAVIAPLDGLVSATEIRPEGTGTGLTKLAGQASLTNYKVKTSYDKPSTWTAVLTPNGNFPWGTQA